MATILILSSRVGACIITWMSLKPTNKTCDDEKVKALPLKMTRIYYTVFIIRVLQSKRFGASTSLKLSLKMTYMQ